LPVPGILQPENAGWLIIFEALLFQAVFLRLSNIIVNKNKEQAMKITENKLPKESLLYPDYSKYDYIDSFQCVLSDFHNKVDIIEIGETFVQPGPGWFEKLMKLRDRIVSVFGLKTSEELSVKSKPGRHNWVPREQAGIFEVIKRTQNEIIMGGDDKHLNARVSLFLYRGAGNPAEKVFNISTLVEYNNFLGRAYFFFIKPFHRAIIPALLRREFEKLEKSINY
jgi:hypothetical protein